MRPNFLVIIVDQMNSFSLGWNGNDEVRTPNLDQLCREGVSFSRAYPANPVCQPSRASLHTGLTPRQHGLTTNGCNLDERIPTLTGALSEHGYRTHCVGKIHLQPFSTDVKDASGQPASWESRDLWNAGEITALPLPFYGYQSVDYVGGHVNYVDGDYVNDVESQRPGTKAELSREKSYFSLPGSLSWRMEIPPEWHYNDWITRKSIDFLKGVGEENFFLVTSFPDPHHPFCATRPYSEMYDPAQISLPANWEHAADPCGFLERFSTGKMRDWDEGILRESIAQTYGMITHIDDCVGRLREAVAELGLADNTVVVFLSDHGDYLGSHHLLFKGPWPYEPVVRVPLIWHTPQGELGTRHSQPVSHLDFAPTVLDYAGIDQAAFDLRGGQQAAPVILPGESLRATIETGAPPQQDGKLMEFDEDGTSDEMCRYRMLITERWKICIYGGFGDGVLFDLENDPLELQNLWEDSDYIVVKAEMLAKLTDRLALTDRMDNYRYCNA
jgi:arylsulfatase A-like enzyme